MGSQFLMSILKDSGIADIAISIVDYFIGRKDSKNAQNGKAGLKIARVVLLRRRVCNECGNGDGRG